MILPLWMRAPEPTDASLSAPPAVKLYFAAAARRQASARGAGCLGGIRRMNTIPMTNITR